MSRPATSDPDPDQDPIEYFLEDIHYHGRADRTRSSYRRVLEAFRAFLEGERASTPAEATYRDCMAWIHSLRGDRAESTIATYATYLHRFYAYMTQVGAFTDNPMALVMEEIHESIDTDPARRELAVDDVRWFLRTTRHPLDRAIIGTFLKTGIRSGELCNLDLRDVHLADAPDGLTLDGRPQLDGRPNSLYVSAEPAQGDVVNGERRTASNKRKRDTVIPIDAELRALLLRWLAIRPDPVSPAEPMFMSTKTGWGRRVTPDIVHHIVQRRATAVGWHRPGGDREENVTPHYFRHFFTTHLRDRTGDRGVVKYLRGDVADDIIDTYTHDWGGRVRAVYEANIYQLL